MKKLWQKALELFRRHIILWVPCTVAGILILALGKLEKAQIQWFIHFFQTQRSVLGGKRNPGICPRLCIERRCSFIRWGS